MTSVEIEALLAQVASGAVTPKTALALLVLNGEDRQHAARAIFEALGGSDTTDVDHAGRPRYVGSGKLVADVQDAIASMSGP